MIGPITQAVYDHIVAAVGAAVDNRIRPIHLPPGHPEEDDVPAVVYRLMHAGQQINMSGGQAIYQVRFQIDVTDRSFSNTLSLGGDIMEEFLLLTDGQIIWSEVDYATFFENVPMQLYRFAIGVSLYVDSEV
jgi:hypothetical protein